MNESGCLLHLRIAFEATNPDRDLQPKPRSASLEIHPLGCAPLPMYRTASTPGSRLATCSFGLRPTKAFVTFRPCGFAPLRQFAPRFGSELVASRYRMRFVMFARDTDLTPKNQGRRPVPHHAFTPFEDFPPPAAVPHRCGRCLPAVHSRPCPKTGRCSLSPTDDLVGATLGISSEAATVSREGVLDLLRSAGCPP